MKMLLALLLGFAVTSSSCAQTGNLFKDWSGVLNYEAGYALSFVLELTPSGSNSYTGRIAWKIKEGEKSGNNQERRMMATENIEFVHSGPNAPVHVRRTGKSDQYGILGDDRYELSFNEDETEFTGIAKLGNEVSGELKGRSTQRSITNIQIIEVKIESEEEEKEERGPDFYTVVEDMPQYPGGDAGLLNYVNKAVSYPPICKENGITGVVYVSYIVRKDGTVGNVKVVRGADPFLDKEAVRVVKSIKGYRAGKERGKPVPVQFTIPLRFILN